MWCASHFCVGMSNFTYLTYVAVLCCLTFACGVLYTVVDVFMRRCVLKVLGSVCSEKECHEKDRIMDGSATGKIECYVNVFLKKPAQKDLFAEVLCTLNETRRGVKMVLWKRMAMRIGMRQLS